MNNWETVRTREKTLIVVEGKHEKEMLFHHLSKSFPELRLDQDKLVIYGTNIYALYQTILREYGPDWKSQDVDLAYLASIGKPRLYADDFINILLIFDYERHDPLFSEQTISDLQAYFNTPTGVGKLYINYPMVESYAHLTELPDPCYDSLQVPASLRPGSKYKALVKNTMITKLMKFPGRLDRALERKCCLPTEERRTCVEELLSLHNSAALQTDIRRILRPRLKSGELDNVTKYISCLLKEPGHLEKGWPFWPYLRGIFVQIIGQNIHKAYILQSGSGPDEAGDPAARFSEIDEKLILDTQNEVSRDPNTGFIWVVNTCVFFVPEYNTALIEEA